MMSSIPPSPQSRQSSLGQKWTLLGQSTTSPQEHADRAVIKVTPPYVVVGFEVNNPEAFTRETFDSLNNKVAKIVGVGSEHWVHHLDKDYGHAFFYVVSAGIIVNFFSFGPAGPGKRGWLNQGNAQNPNTWDQGAILKDGYADSRPGTPDYSITEATKLFKISLSKDQCVKLTQETGKERREIMSGKEKYTAFMNDTCAEAARDVLDAAGVSTPSGSGFVNKAGAPWVHAVNPYMWHHRFKEAGYVEAQMAENKKLWEDIVNAVNKRIGAGEALTMADPASAQWPAAEDRKITR